MFSIIIPAYNQHEITQSCLDSIEENTSGDYEVIVVDNGSVPSIPNARIRNEANEGFPKAVNQGIKEAIGETIIILNNDVIVTPYWASLLQSHLNYYDIVGPCTNSISGPQQVLVDRYDNKEGLYAQALKLQIDKAYKSMPFHRVVFFCVAIKRAVIDKIGLLDEIFSPGNFEDDDYCMRAIEAGFRTGIAQDVFVHHFGSSTFRESDINYGQLSIKNRGIFNAKWPKEKYKELSERNNAD